MKSVIDETRDAARRSFIDSANDAAGEFPIQILPLGIFSRPSGDAGPGVAIGDQIFDLRAAHRHGLLPADIPAEVLAQASLNALFGLGRGRLWSLRRKLFALLSGGRHRRGHAPACARSACREERLPSASAKRGCELHRLLCRHLPRTGRRCIVDARNPLPANYKWAPIAYHGRASSVQMGQGTVRQPPWDPLLFNGEALWTYLSTPFLLAMDGDISEVGFE